MRLILSALSVFLFLSTPILSQWSKLASQDPCYGISVRSWSNVPAQSWTVQPDFDATAVPVDFLTINTGNDYSVKFPNGFRKAQIYEDNDPPFCLNLNGVANKMVLLSVQTVNANDRLCIRDTSSNSVRGGAVQERCFMDRTTACFQALSYQNDLTVVFYTDSAGSTTSTPFWYRVRVSDRSWDLSGDAAGRADSANSNLEMWCMMESQNTNMTRFPNDLRSNVAPSNAALSQSSSASSTSHSVAAILSAVFMTIMAILKA